ncbi:MAG TPA: EutN/CcmL family microcompartment protein [Candidatus Eremiobacteraeota bacterium]|nr:MAG: Carbon dioxide concentrating mechanism protein CcmL [bacterium ADurb.Bin363]HPZ09686.1 EutN/CcmL family microcompartment protein [Candidatus Eremiobacteraeota bacterium]
MFIGKVTGVLWATQKSPGLEGLKMLLVQKMHGISGKLSGKPVMAVADKIDAGIGDIVLVMDEGGSARSILNRDNAPIRTIIAGIIDQVSMNGEKIKYY